MQTELLKRVRDFAQVRYDGMITYEVAQTALDLLEVDSMGLDATDRNLLETMIEKFMGKTSWSRYIGSSDWRGFWNDRRRV